MDKASFEMLDDELLPEESMEGEEVDFVEKLFSELEKSTKNTSNMSLEDLQKQMNEAIANEDYELAARLRDEITKREKLE
jgi:protein-arginine kinase activator protein McsA